MISFVWSSKYPFYAGAGGSETYTAGHIRELRRRGIAARIITLGHPDDDGRAGFPDIPFKALHDKSELSELNDTLVFVTYPLNVKTKKPAYTILHCPPPEYNHNDKLYDIPAMKTKHLLATSKFAAKLWRNYLGLSTKRIPVIYPFADPQFSKVIRPNKDEEAYRVLFAGRLTPDKGVYTLLASLHMEALKNIRMKLTVTKAGSHSEDGKIILRLMEAHPQIEVVEAGKSPSEMAALMAEHDCVVMPSTAIFWQEMFGMVSVEAQHAGCRVVASNSGGLAETNCGQLLLTKPDDPHALAKGIYRVSQMRAVSPQARQIAGQYFSLEKSTNALLAAIKQPESREVPLHRGKALFPRLEPHFAALNVRLKG